MTNPTQDILLTDDGHPIGEIVMADQSNIAAMPNDRTVEENREDLMRQKASELTGEPDADAAITQLYPGYEDSDKRKRALALVVAEGRSVEDTAEAIGVPARTVAMWSYNGKWAVLVRAEARARHEQSLLELSRLRSRKRTEIAKKQLEQAEEIRDAAIEQIREKGVTMSAQSAWTAAAKVEQTLVGVSEAGGVTDTEGKENQKDQKTDGKTPLVMVFQGGGLPPVRKV